MQIKKMKLTDIEMVAKIIRVANLPVAEQFGLNRDNAPAHPSFCTPEWIRSGLARGEQYVICNVKDMAAGCVAYENPGDKDPGTAYLNRLAVLPEHQGNGIGEWLVKHVIDMARTDRKKAVSIGIIRANQRLKNWYKGLGFVSSGTKTFDHLPFDVQFMKYHMINAKNEDTL